MKAEAIGFAVGTTIAGVGALVGIETTDPSWWVVLFVFWFGSNLGTGVERLARALRTRRAERAEREELARLCDEMRKRRLEQVMGRQS